MSQNGQTHFKNLAANAARFLKGVLPYWDILHGFPLSVTPNVLDNEKFDEMINSVNGIFFYAKITP